MERQDNESSFKRYSNRATLVEHLGNLLRSIRIQNHHLIEIKRPRTPLKLPHLRYRARIWRDKAQVRIQFGKSPLQIEEMSYL